MWNRTEVGMRVKPHPRFVETGHIALLARKKVRHGFLEFSQQLRDFPIEGSSGDPETKARTASDLCQEYPVMVSIYRAVSAMRHQNTADDCRLLSAIKAIWLNFFF